LNEKLENKTVYHWGVIIVSIVTLFASILLFSIGLSRTLIFLLLIWVLWYLVWSLYEKNKIIKIDDSTFLIDEPEINTKINETLIINLFSMSFKVGNTNIFFRDTNYKKIIKDHTESEWTYYFQKEENNILESTELSSF